MSIGIKHKEYQLRRLRAGGSTLVDAGRTAAHIGRLRQRMSYGAIARQTNTSHSYIRAIHQGVVRNISPAREAAILAAGQALPTDTSHVSSLFARRRLRALHARGWSWAMLARESETLSLAMIKELARGKWDVIEGRNDNAVRELYDRLSMRLPVAANHYEQGGITRAQLAAKRKGWLPPLAWDDGQLDNPDAVPRRDDPDRQTKRLATRGQLPAETTIENAEWMADADENLTAVCARLNIQPETFYQTCRRAGRTDLYARLSRREPDGDLAAGMRDTKRGAA